MKTTTRGMLRRCAFGLLAGSLVLTGGPCLAATQIDVWHAFTGRLGELLDEQVKNL